MSGDQSRESNAKCPRRGGNILHRTIIHLLLRKWDWRNARPHPDPLPQERGKHAQFPEFSRPLVWNCFRGLASATAIRDQRFDIFARAASRILRSRSVRLWMPCAEILSRIGSTSLLIKSGPAVTSDETFCPLLRNDRPGARTLAGACKRCEFRNRDQRPTQRSES